MSSFVKVSDYRKLTCDAGCRLPDTGLKGIHSNVWHPRLPAPEAQLMAGRQHPVSGIRSCQGM